jgi:hypothetical protein
VAWRDGANDAKSTSLIADERANGLDRGDPASPPQATGTTKLAPASRQQQQAGIGGLGAAVEIYYCEFFLRWTVGRWKGGAAYRRS